MTYNFTFDLNKTIISPIIKGCVLEGNTWLFEYLKNSITFIFIFSILALVFIIWYQKYKTKISIICTELFISFIFLLSLIDMILITENYFLLIFLTALVSRIVIVFVKLFYQPKKNIIKD